MPLSFARLEDLHGRPGLAADLELVPVWREQYRRSGP